MREICIQKKWVWRARCVRCINRMQTNPIDPVTFSQLCFSPHSLAPHLSAWESHIQTEGEEEIKKTAVKVNNTSLIDLDAFPVGNAFIWDSFYHNFLLSLASHSDFFDLLRKFYSFFVFLEYSLRWCLFPWWHKFDRCYLYASFLPKNHSTYSIPLKGWHQQHAKKSVLHTHT